MQNRHAFQFVVFLLLCCVVVTSDASALDRWLARTSDSDKECWLYTSEPNAALQIAGPYKSKKEAYHQLCERLKQGKDCDSIQYANPAQLCREYGVELD